LEDQAHVAKMRANADADFYTAQKKGEANKLLLTKEYLEVKRIDAIAANNKIYYGSHIPNFFLGNDWHSLGTSGQSIAQKGASDAKA